MSKRCPSCGFSNEDARIYCGSCGELLDAELRLIRDLDKHTAGAAGKPKYKAPPPRREPVRTPRPDFDDAIPEKLAREKKSSPWPWILLAAGLVAVAVGIWILSYAV